MTRGLILDRDGVINVDSGYVHRIEECHFIDGIFDLVRHFAARGFVPAIATNQAGIGRGYYGERDFVRFTDWMLGEFRRHDVEIARVYHCPDHPTEGLGAYRRENAWRKPGPGMFLQAIEDFGLDPVSSWCIGDKPTDIAAAAAAGIGTRVLFDPAAAAVDLVDGTDAPAHWVAPRHADIATLLDRLDGRPAR
ncbi:MAG TPA: HAD family hydrolase [Stellaceae bacterium]|nr:HAD family hydrolase [Stellaceae bacterium]